MLTDAAGLLFTSAVVGDNKTIPPEYRFKEEDPITGVKVSEGVLMSRELIANALSVPTDTVHFLRKGHTINTDDMACIYSKLGNLSLNIEPGLVLRSSTENRSFSCYRDARKEEAERLTGRKARFTTMIDDAGGTGTPWIQFPNCSTIELPPETVPEGFLVVRIMGLSIDGNIASNTNTFGYIVLMTAEKGVEARMFAAHTKLVIEPHVDALRTLHNLNPQDPHARVLLTNDGGMTQMQALITKESLEARDSRNETIFIATSVGTSTTVTLKILRETYQSRKVMQSFTQPGWRDLETMQAPDIYAIMRTLKRTFSEEEKKKWLEDIPKFIQALRDYDHVPESQA